MIAALDCGTNSTRLLIVRPDGTTHRRLMRITRLGQGVDATGALAPEAIERTVGVLRQYRVAMDEAGVTRGRLVCTSAVRDAANGEAFLRAAGDAVGFPAELLSGHDEGQLAYAGATADLDPVAGDDIVVDIGGGSTEIVVHRDGVVDAHSLDIGCVRLTERFLHHDPPTAAEIAAMMRCIEEQLALAQQALPALRAPVEPRRLLGLAGSVTTLAALALGLPEYDGDRIHHTVLTRPVVEQWCDTLAAETTAQRAGRGAMVSGRQDVIVGGVHVLKGIMVHLDLPTCVASESDILDGIALSLRP